MYRNDPQIVQFCDDPKNIHNCIIVPPKIYIFLKTLKNIHIKNFKPSKMVWAYVFIKISEYPPETMDPFSREKICTYGLWLVKAAV